MELCVELCGRVNSRHHIFLFRENMIKTGHHDLLSFGQPREVIVMSTLHEASIKRETLNIRIKADERDLIGRAASARGKTRTGFILQAARLAAEEALLDQRFMATSQEAFAEFLARLDQPPQTNERLRKSLQTPAPWDKA